MLKEIMEEVREGRGASREMFLSVIIALVGMAITFLGGSIWFTVGGVLICALNILFCSIICR